MDSARFMRKRSVLAAWLIVPALLALITELGSAGFRDYQKMAAQRSRMLEALVPQMNAENLRFEKFLADYQISADPGESVEDAFINLINATAEDAGCTVSSVKLVQEPVDGAPGMTRIRISLEATGTGRAVANFLKNIKNTDPRIYEERVLVMRSAEDADDLQIEADLGKICTAGREPGL
jgi:hypothetical protein